MMEKGLQENYYELEARDRKRKDFTRYLVYIVLCLSCYTTGISIGQWCITDSIISVVFNTSVTFSSVVSASYSLGISLYSLSFSERVSIPLRIEESYLLKSYCFTFSMAALAMIFAAASSKYTQDRISDLIHEQVSNGSLAPLTNLQSLWFHMRYWKVLIGCNVATVIAGSITSLKSLLKHE